LFQIKIKINKKMKKEINGINENKVLGPDPHPRRGVQCLLSTNLIGV
jgi:hypothetical protein